jgi:hypothetical protein
VTVLVPSGYVAFTYDSATRGYVSTTTLEPGQGAWVKSTIETDIELTATE